ncbi:Type I restriction enzyme EcoKI specificity protein [Megamonas hypermegale]|uniref:Type I restriction enzyme EcoKI specificity protein n=2 Tax=Megamonas TaxID=158846 RepID=A0A378NZL8_9FIRM|nr:restriction endonuclease subunit S [Megamonas hypermegale]STY71448.1 Type I restriction enzyme EcoKI specificity protein [Megamonas hypermegale]
MLADKLRKSVLQSAIQGKLTEQLATDDKVEDLLQAIKEEKELLIKEKKIKKQKTLPEITEEEIPFEIPENWKWVRLGEITSIKGGKRIPVGKKLTTVNTGYKYIRVADMKNGTVIDTDIHYIDEEIYKKISSYTISKNDVYITCAGTIGRIGIVPDFFDGANLTENADKIILYFINKLWLCYALNSEAIQNQIRNVTTKVGQPKLAIKRIENMIIPLPPLAEQKRIVEKLDNVLANIDELKANEEKLSILQKNFPDKLKKSILQSAIQGKLTEQLATDDNVEDLLQAIKEEKERLIKEKKIKKQKPLPEITEDEIPFAIPENWKWVRLGEVILLNMGQSPNSEDVGNDGIEFHQGKIYFTDEIIGFSDKYCSKPKKISNANEILLSVRAPVGEVNLNNREICIGRGLASIKIINSEERYFFYLLFYCKKIFEKKSTGTTFKAISKDIIENLLIPLPPLAEQKRIVEKLDKLLADIEELKI